MVIDETVIVVRPARREDTEARLELMREVLAETYFDSFLYFFFQELTLEGVVLCGAVLFIFGGVGAGACALLLPAAAALAALAVRLHAAALLATEPAKLKGELLGLVAEVVSPRAPPHGAPPPPPPARPRVLLHHELAEGYADGALYKQVVGSVSVCRAEGGGGAWWVRALGVRRRWRRRGAGAALAGAARAAAAAQGVPRLLAAVSHLQPRARRLLHKHGWECRGTYHRPLLGAALVLPMAQLALPLPHA